MKFGNYMTLDFPSKSSNEAFARSAVACFAAQMDPTLEELGDIRTAVSEAVTNCIVHAYKEQFGYIFLTVQIFEDNRIIIKIRDKGCGIDDIKKAREPLYTSLGGERSGLGFSVMESFSDSLRVRSKVGVGTTVTVDKKIKGKNQ